MLLTRNQPAHLNCYKCTKNNFTFGRFLLFPAQCCGKYGNLEPTVSSTDNTVSRSWTTSSRHLTGTHMQTKSKNPSLNVVKLSSVQRKVGQNARTQQNTTKATYFVSRWEVLQSLLRVPKFICIHLSWQSKTWPLITAWLLWKGGRMRHQSLFYAFDKPETKFQMIKLMLICLS